MMLMAEKLYLLALDESKGTLRLGVRRPIIAGICGSLLLELSQRGKVRIRGDMVEMQDPGETGDLLLDHMLKNVLRSRSKPLKDMLKTLMEDEVCYEKQVLQRLEEQGLVRRVQGRKLGFIPVERNLPNREQRMNIQNEIRTAVLANRLPDSRTLAFLSMIRALDLIPEVFGISKRMDARRTLHQWTAAEPVGVNVEKLYQTVAAGSGLV